MEHHFNIDIASKYGVDEAIMFNHLLFWITHNAANEKNFYEGHYWTFNSLVAFEKLFPYWSRRQIERILKSLETKGLLLTGNYNKSSYDRTKWYSFTDKALKECGNPLNDIGKSISPNGEMEEHKNVNGNTQNVTPIPYINTGKKLKIENTNKKEKGGMNALIDNYTSNNDLKECLKEFIKMRAAKKKPMTDRALKLLLNELDKLSEEDNMKIKILEQSILNSWQGVFPLKNYKDGGNYDNGTNDNGASKDPYDLW